LPVGFKQVQGLRPAQAPAIPGCADSAFTLATRLCLLQDKAAVQQQKASGWLPKVGQSVFVPRLGKRAKVVAVDSTTGALTLQAGLIKVTATPDEVRQK